MRAVILADEGRHAHRHAEHDDHGDARHDAETAAVVAAEIAERRNLVDVRKLVRWIDLRVHLHPAALEVHELEHVGVDEVDLRGRRVLVVEDRDVLEQQRTVGATKPEGVGQHGRDGGFTRGVGDVVEVAGGVGVVVIDRGVHHALQDRLDAGHGFDATGAAPYRGALVVQDGRILDVGPAVKAPKGAQVIDARGEALTPGFFDVHTHWTPAGAPAITPKIADAYVAAGKVAPF